MSLPSIFLSHSSRDDDWVNCFAGKLQALGYNLWIDEQGILGADQFVRVIQTELERRDVLLVVLSPDAWSSPWVQREIQLALATNKTIVPVMHKPTAVEGFFRIFQQVDVVGKGCEDAATTVAKVPAMASDSGDSRNREPITSDSGYDILIEPTALLNYAKTHVDDEIVKRAEIQIQLWDKTLADAPWSFGEAIRDSLQIYTHARSADQFFRERWYADEKRRVLQRRCSEDWVAYLFDGMDAYVKLCPPELAGQIQDIVASCPGLTAWLEDTLVTNLLFALWLAKRKLTEHEVYMLHRRLGNERCSSVLDRSFTLSKAVKR